MSVPELVGVGSPLIDLVCPVDDDFLAAQVHGRKGGMEQVEASVIDDLHGRALGRGTRSPGGAAANTTIGAAALGIDAAFAGCCGKDADGAFFRRSLEALGCRSWMVESDHLSTGRVLCLVSPDGERTMRTALGAAVALPPALFTTSYFSGVRLVMLEGYTLFDHALTRAVAAAAKAANCVLALDMASFEVVEANRSVLAELLDGTVDLVFANEREAQAWLGEGIEAALDDLAQRTAIAVVKVGADGAWVAHDGKRCHIPADPVAKVVDTIGAGDNWAAGFLAGYLRGLDPAQCGRLGALAGAATVQTAGAHLPSETWLRLRGWLDAWR